VTMSRRTFLVRAGEVGAGAGALVLAGMSRNRRTYNPWDPSYYAPPKHANVAVAKSANYDGDLESLVREGLTTIGADVKGKRVLLKPNMVEYDAGTVINTDPRLVAATVLAVRRLGALDVTVGDGPGHRRDTDFVLAASGLESALKATDAPFIDLNTAPVRLVGLHTAYTNLGVLWLPEPVVTADVIISMPKLKTHHWAGVTLSLKNLFGCVPGRVYGWPKNVLHWAGLNEAIIDVAAAVRPHYAIVDGIVGMEGNGPIQGTAKAAGVLVFGDDPVATDTVAARVMGFNHERIGYLAEAARFLGEGRWERIDHRGEDPERVASNFAVLPQFQSLKLT
jgi:uncharacterized protein (DUF362 family)